MCSQCRAVAVSLGLIIFGWSLEASVAAKPQPPPSAALTIAVQARSIRPGELVVLTVAARKAIDAVHARAFDRDLPAFSVNPQTWRVLVAIDLDTALRTYPVEVEATTASGVLHATQSLAVVARPFRTRRLTVDPAFVNPPAEVLDRIARETAELNALWSQGATTKLWTRPFVRPVPDEANSAFGTRSILNGEARSPHSGADFNSAAGTPDQVAEYWARRSRRRSLLHGQHGRDRSRPERVLAFRALVRDSGTGGRHGRTGPGDRKGGRDRACHGAAPALERAYQRRARRPLIAAGGAGTARAIFRLKPCSSG